MTDFIIKENLSSVDPQVKEIIDLENERQNRKLILIPSESLASFAVRESLGSVLQNIYAEGYPPEETRTYSETEILDLENQLARYRRYSTNRYYKGVEFVDILEELARRRCAELFANSLVSADDFFVNVQPLSGAPANNAVYHALIEPGETILGMSLFHGGHLTHGASVNRSGKLYSVFHYCVDPKSEKIDYDQLAELAYLHKPRIIIAGFSSYPWCPDWKKYRKIADSVGAYLFADVSHIAGLIAGNVLPSPVGFADVITFTTHKTLCGPRGACILSFDESISKKIDKAVFPGEQGGPHVQVFAAMATAFKLAGTPKFAKFQKQIVKNCIALSNQLSQRGLHVVYGGTNTHLANIDCKSIIGSDRTPLSGDMAARILDLVGIVTNANAIPGDKSALNASGIRLGTPWVTQQGFIEEDMINIADAIADTLFKIEPYSIWSGKKREIRSKISFQPLEDLKIKVRELIKRAIPSSPFDKSGYPFHHFIDDFESKSTNGRTTFQLTGEKIRQCLHHIVSEDIEKIRTGDWINVHFYINNTPYTGMLQMQSSMRFYLSVETSIAGIAAEWLRGLSDGFIKFDEDLLKRIPGPFIVKEEKDVIFTGMNDTKEASISYKPYFIGIDNVKNEFQSLSDFKWIPHDSSLKRTVLYDWHLEQKAKIIPFAGWEMPVWHTSIFDEHLATRNSAGIFDVTHMGIFQVQGIDAISFLDSVCANDIGALQVGQSCYTHFLDPQANVIDDLLVYRHLEESYMMVVNAANEEKDWAWLKGIIEGRIKIDNQRPWAKAFGRNCRLSNLKNPTSQEDMRVDIALQGPKSIEILEGLKLSKKDFNKITRLKWAELCHVNWNNHDMIISRTGYTGERIAFEIFIHPKFAVDLWISLIQVGEPLGLKPCGLGARDSLRTEAGLPLYGHEMGGELNLGIGEAGFGSFGKIYKPWFIGREAFILKEQKRKSIVIRFQFAEKNVRMAHPGDPVISEKGKVIGTVTSCAIDKSGFLTGQAIIESDYTAEGQAIFIYQSSSNADPIVINSLSEGMKIQLPSKAIVISRFMK